MKVLFLMWAQAGALVGWFDCEYHALSTRLKCSTRRDAWRLFEGCWHEHVDGEGGDFPD